MHASLFRKHPPGSIAPEHFQLQYQNSSGRQYHTNSTAAAKYQGFARAGQLPAGPLDPDQRETENLPTRPDTTRENANISGRDPTQPARYPWDRVMTREKFCQILLPPALLHFGSISHRAAATAVTTATHPSPPASSARSPNWL